MFRFALGWVSSMKKKKQSLIISTQPHDYEGVYSAEHYYAFSLISVLKGQRCFWRSPISHAFRSSPSPTQRPAAVSGWGRVNPSASVWAPTALTEPPHCRKKTVLGNSEQSWMIFKSADLAILYIKAKSNSVLFSFDAVLCSYWPPFEKHQTTSHHRSPNFSGIFKCQLRLLSLLFHTGWISDSILPPMIWCGIAP